MALFDDASLVVTPNGYKAGTLYSIKPTSGLGDMTVVRATTATRVNSAGLIESVANNVPRLDYSNGTCPSLLVEPQSTNLVTYSEQFDNAAWTGANATVTANNTTSPDGTQNADKLFANIATIVNPAEILQATSQTANTTYSYSVYAKKSTSNFIAIRLTSVTGNPYAWFNLNTGTIGTVQTGLTSSIINVGNGYYRCTVIGTTPAVIAVNRVDIIVSDNDANYVCALNGSIFIWGAQLELGSYPTSYIPTTTAAVTRNADVVSKTGISSLIGQTEGTIFADIKYDSNIGSTKIITGLATGTSSFVYSFISGTTLVLSVYNSGTLQCYLTYSLPSSGRYKIAMGYKLNDFIVYVNGANVASQISGSVPSCSNLYLGNDFLTVYNKLEYNSAILFPTRLTNAELASLTTI